MRPVALRRQRWETSDGDFLDVDQLPGEPGSSILVLLPGLEGSTRSKQITGLFRAGKAKGWQGLGVNFRSCSGQPNRGRRSYHGGETADLAWILDRVIATAQGSPIFCVGFSLGGNILLKYLGEQGDSLPPSIRAAAAISTPFDLAESVRTLERGSSRVYMTRLVRSLKAKTLAKLKKFPDVIDRQRLAAISTLTEFDDLVTAPVHGFKDAAEYWRTCSSKHFLSQIRRPTLLINAKDDPFFPEKALPWVEVSQNRFLTAEFTSGGGHLGFLSGLWPGRPVPWAENRVVRFLEDYVTGESNSKC